MLHKGLLLLFRNRPTLAPELLRDALGLHLLHYSEVRVESAELTEVVPTKCRADLVVLLLDGKPIFAVVGKVIDAGRRRLYVDLSLSLLWRRL